MDYATPKEKAEEWNISLRRVQILCETNRINGAMKFSKVWAIPKDASQPFDKRRKSTKTMED